MTRDPDEIEAFATDCELEAANLRGHAANDQARALRPQDPEWAGRMRMRAARLDGAAGVCRERAAEIRQQGVGAGA